MRSRRSIYLITRKEHSVGGGASDRDSIRTLDGHPELEQAVQDCPKLANTVLGNPTVSVEVASSFQPVFVEVTSAFKNMALHWERAAAINYDTACALNAAAHKQYDTRVGGTDSPPTHVLSQAPPVPCTRT